MEKLPCNDAEAAALKIGVTKSADDSDESHLMIYWNDDVQNQRKVAAIKSLRAQLWREREEASLKLTINTIKEENKRLKDSIGKAELEEKYAFKDGKRVIPSPRQKSKGRKAGK